MRSDSRLRLLVVLLLAPALFIALGWPALTENSGTYDEADHLPSGYLSLTRGDYRVGPDHPPLVKLLFALPLPSLRPRISGEAERALAAATHDLDALWIFGDRFLYKDNQPEPILFRARLVVLALGALLVLCVFAWGRAVFGTPGGVVAAALSALDPNLLAHGTLATADLGFTLFFFASLYFARRTLRDLTVRDALATAALLGAAFTSKHSAFLLLPTLVLFALVRLASTSPWRVVSSGTLVRTLRRRSATLLLLFVFWGLASWASIWTVYGFRYAAARDGSGALPLASWLQMLREDRLIAETLATGKDLPDDATLQRMLAADPPHLIERSIAAAADLRLLPEAYLFGLTVVAKSAYVRRNYLLGDLSLTGWTWYFPFATLVKTPCATLVLLTLTAVALVGETFRVSSKRTSSARLREIVWLVSPAVVVLLSAMQSRVNIGFRHILPMVPFLCTAAGCLPRTLERLLGRRAAFLGLGAMVLVLAVETFSVRPYFLTFFNAFAGGPRGGLRLLSDSNLDWGQGLVALRRWMEHEGVERVNLCYFGTADPAAYGVRFVPLPGTDSVEVPGVGRTGYASRAPALPGYLAISATHLQGPYLYPERLRDYYAFLRQKDPVAVPGNAIYVYWLDRWGE